MEQGSSDASTPSFSHWNLLFPCGRIPFPAVKHSSPPKTTMDTAARARARAEARRARILAQSEDRINVVSGLTPRSTAREASAAGGATIEKVGDEGIDIVQRCDEFSSIVGDNTDNADDNDVAAVDVDAVVVSNVSDPPAVQIVGDADEARGARRMAAMRRRRVKGGGGGSSKSEMAGEEKITTDDTIVESGEISTAGTMEEPVLVVEAEESSPTVAKTTNRVSESVTLETTAKHMDIDDEDVEQKKYMGVARMRRKRLKEEKEKRLQEIANDGDSPRSTVELIATLGVTATTMRKGAVATVDVNGIVGVNGGSSKKTKKSWITFLIPPMKLMPRIVTLLLLFIAGFDLGTQPHRPTPSSLTSLYPQHSIDDLRVLFGSSHLIHRIETSLTKPWEYGMGGRVAYMTGRAASAPPTAMPTYFDNKVAEMEDECIVNGAVGECTASPIDGVNGGSATKERKNRLQTLLDKKRNNNNNNNNKKVKIKDRLQELAKGDNSIDVGGAVNDDEFNNPDRTTKPMGVLDITNIVIDPIFRVDLDSLLYNANLPVPIEYAAKVAISFHRLWVYYLWTMPTTVLKSMVGMPRRVISGWIANPPYMLCVALVIRFVTRVVVGNGKSPFSLDSSKDDGGWAGGGGNNSSGGGVSSLGKNNLDLLTKGMDFVKNYASSKFPMTSLVVGTLSKVMKVDMYVLLCGLLIGLAITPIDEDDDYLLSTWGDDGGGSIENVVRRSVLGDGEL